MEALVLQKKSLGLILVKQTQNLAYVYILYYTGNSYLFVNVKEIFMFIADNKNISFPTRLCLESISNGFSTTESREVSLNGNVNDFSVDCNSIDKSDILNIHKCLITKNKIK